MKIKYLVLFFVALGLAGCGIGQGTVQPTLQATKALEPILTPTIKSSPTPTPSIPPLPSETLYAIQNAEEASALLTEEARATINAAFPFTCKDAYTIDRFSPDKTWRVLNCEHKDPPKMVVENREGTIWELKYEDFLGPEAKEHGIAVSANLYPLHWSPDGHYLYFTSYGGAEGGGTCFYGFGVEGLFRLDLQTGKVSTILSIISSSDEWNGYEVSFSPTGRRFSYSRGYAEGKNSFHLVDVLTGQETTFSTEQQNGTFTWSPDGTSLAYSTSLCNFTTMTAIYSFIKVLTISNLSTRTIAQSDTDFLIIDGWSEETNLLTIESLNYSTNKTKTLSLDPQKSISIVSATATP